MILTSSTGSEAHWGWPEVEEPGKGVKGLDSCFKADQIVIWALIIRSKHKVP